MKELAIKKLYYSISEVSKITSLKPHVLRYWESEFQELKPSKNRAGKRIYKLNDIKLIFLIKKLLYAEKYTIEGAKQRLKILTVNNSNQLDLIFNEGKREHLIHEIRQDLNDIINILENG